MSPQLLFHKVEKRKSLKSRLYSAQGRQILFIPSNNPGRGAGTILTFLSLSAANLFLPLTAHLPRLPRLAVGLAVDCSWLEPRSLGPVDRRLNGS
jgi:hypothetical protein